MLGLCGKSMVIRSTQDTSVFHNIDAEAELTALLSEAFAAEIDREIIKNMEIQ
jgi:hypothetical protein